MLRRLGLRPKKGLGQHFLVDSSVLRHIVNAAELSPADVVIEVGPGLGILTRELAAHAGKVIALEKDEALAAALARELAEYNNVRIVPGDILDIDLAHFLTSEARLPERPNYKVVANLPYYVASAVVRHFLEAIPNPRLLVVMVQREVAQAMVAGPGDMSLLSVSVQFYGQARIVARVSPRSFYPPPKVHSAVVRIDPSPSTPLPTPDIPEFFRLVRAAFSARRKQLRNSLVQGLSISPEEAMVYLEKAGIDPKRRAETVSLGEWSSLWKAYWEGKVVQSG